MQNGRPLFSSVRLYPLVVIPVSVTVAPALRPFSTSVVTVILLFTVVPAALNAVMSNVGATVLLVPLAVSIALAAGGDPAIFAMTVAISTSNSFLIPTHQVNALIMGPARYRVTDFIRAGGGMTLLFLLVSISMMNLIF